MPRLATVIVSTMLLASSFMGSVAYAGSAATAGSGHHDTQRSGHSGAPLWRETVIDADQSSAASTQSTDEQRG